MKIQYDPKHDLMNIVFLEEKIEESEEKEGIIIDYTKDRRIASIEVLDAKHRVGLKESGVINIETIG